MAADPAPKFLSQAQFAARRGVSRKSVTSWKQKGLLVLSAEGLVDVEQTEWNLDQRPATYRGGVTHRPIRQQVTTSADNNKPAAKSVAKPKDKSAERLPAASEQDESVEDLDLASINLPMVEAVRRKENFLGLLRRHEFEVANREWVRVEDVGRLVEREYEAVKERLLTTPGKMAHTLVGKSMPEIEAMLRLEVVDILTELSNPWRENDRR